MQGPTEEGLQNHLAMPGRTTCTSAVFLLDIYPLVLKTSGGRDYLTSSHNLFQHLFQTIRNLMVSLI